MWYGKTLQIRSSAALAAAIAMAAVVISPPPAAAASVYLAAIDEPDSGGGTVDGPGRDTPAGPESRRGSRAPSEDGTNDGADEASPDVINPDMANPETPPGCPFTHQPLELLI
jgi:hypothetical protein